MDFCIDWETEHKVTKERMEGNFDNRRTMKGRIDRRSRCLVFPSYNFQSSAAIKGALCNVFTGLLTNNKKKLLLQGIAGSLIKACVPQHVGVFLSLPCISHTNKSFSAFHQERLGFSLFGFVLSYPCTKKHTVYIFLFTLLKYTFPKPFSTFYTENDGLPELTILLDIL